MRRTVLVVLGAATALFVVTLLLAQGHHVAAWERDVVTWFNEAPDWIATLLWPVMQLGTMWLGVVAVGLVAAFAVSPERGLAVLASGVAAWFLAKVVKSLVERGRPIEYLTGIDFRGEHAAGFGYVSGHTAVAFAVATALLPALPRGGRIVAYLLAPMVGVARMVYGVHFPLDVIGGACLGIMCACVVELALEFLQRRFGRRGLWRSRRAIGAGESCLGERRPTLRLKPINPAHAEQRSSEAHVADKAGRKRGTEYAPGDSNPEPAD